MVKNLFHDSESGVQILDHGGSLRPELMEKSLIETEKQFRLQFKVETGSEKTVPKEFRQQRNCFPELERIVPNDPSWSGTLSFSLGQ